MHVLTVGAMRREVSSRGWSIRSWLRYPTRCHGLFGLLLPLLFIEPPLLGFVGVEMVCIRAVLPSCSCFFFSLGKASMSPVITGLQVVCFEVGWGGLCVYSQLFSHLKATRSPLAQSGSALHGRGSGSCHCSLGNCSCPVCLSVYLSALVCKLFVSPCRGRTAGLMVSVPLQWHWFGVCSRDKFTHSS